MKIEYLEDGSPDCPLIRIYGSDGTGLRHLRAAIRDLISGAKDSIALHQLPGFEAVDGCELTLRVASTARQKGVHQQTGALDFEWALSLPDWDTVAELIPPFIERGFQWLHDGKIDIAVRRRTMVRRSPPCI
jgi:hypothetical protein